MCVKSCIINGLAIAAGCAAGLAAADRPAHPPTGLLGANLGGLERAGSNRGLVVISVPETYDADTAWPLLIHLHGGPGGSAVTMAGVFEEDWRQLNAISIYPQALVNGIQLEWSYPDFGSRYILHAIDEIASIYHIDPARIYLTGHSMGGGGTWSNGTASPSQWAGLGPMAGSWSFSPGTPSASAMKDLPIHILHGASDSTVPVANSDLADSALDSAGATRVRYDRVSGAGHSNVLDKTLTLDGESMPARRLVAKYLLPFRRDSVADRSTIIDELTAYGTGFFGQSWSPEGGLFGSLFDSSSDPTFTANPTSSVASPQAGQFLTLSADARDDDDSESVTLHWDLGPAGEAWGRSVTTSFPEGTHSLRVTAWDQTGHGVFFDITLPVAAYSDAPLIEVEATDPEGSETGDAVTFTFRRSGDLSDEITAAIQWGGSAHEGISGAEPADVDDRPGSVTFAAGVDTATVTLTPQSDSRKEGRERIIATVSGASGYAIGESASAVAWIADDDGGPTVSVFLPDGDLTEGETALLQLERSGSTSGDLTVDLLIDGSADDGDFSGWPASWVIPDGTARLEVPLVAIADGAEEGVEVLRLEVRPSGSYTVGTHDIAALRVLDGEAGGDPDERIIRIAVSDAAGPLLDLDPVLSPGGLEPVLEGSDYVFAGLPITADATIAFAMLPTGISLVPADRVHEPAAAAGIDDAILPLLRPMAEPDPAALPALYRE